mmetsp:Transcript_77068/g.198471  ORF Transcript_77068/g.198471 Transcript_77068/m.198471 type:complete len:221 (-) Transcript_77068:799-1461(-)
MCECECLAKGLSMGSSMPPTCRLMSVSSDSARDCIVDRREVEALALAGARSVEPRGGATLKARARVCSRSGRCEALRLWRAGGGAAAAALRFTTPRLKSPTAASMLRSSWMRGLSSSAVTSRGSVMKDARLPLKGTSSNGPLSTRYDWPTPEAMGTRFAANRSLPERGMASRLALSAPAFSSSACCPWVMKNAAAGRWMPSVSAMCFSMSCCWSPCSFAP